MSDSSQEFSDGGADASGSQGFVRRLLTVDPNRFDMLFTAALLVFMGALIVLSFDLSENSRRVPLVVAVPTFVMLGVVMVILVSDRASAFVEQYTSGSILGVDKDIGVTDDDSDDEEPLDPEEELYQRRKRQVIAFSSVLSLVALVYIIGFSLAIPIFLIVLYRWWAEQSWLVTVVTTVVVWLFIVVIFYVLLNVRLYRGLFGFDIVRYLPF